MWLIEKLLRRQLPVRTVSRDEFIQATTARGTPLAAAEFQAKLCQALGSEVLVGDEYLRIEE